MKPRKATKFRKQTAILRRIQEARAKTELIELFQKELEEIAIHQLNWLHQAQQFRNLKDNLKDNEIEEKKKKKKKKEKKKKKKKKKKKTKEKEKKKKQKKKEKKEKKKTKEKEKKKKK
ncbi:unnamed protein product [Arctogadus glacialis]